MNISKRSKRTGWILIILFIIGLATFPFATIATVWIGAIIYDVLTC